MILSDREDNPDYHVASIRYTDRNGNEVILPVRLKVRGNFRRDPDNCSFPPLLVNFKKQDVKGTLFNEQNKIKLVTPCQDQKYVWREYMIYKLYNMVTEYSFRVRMMKVDYFDSTSNQSYFTRYSFFLEDNDLMAQRNHMVVTDKFYNPYQLNRDEIVKLDLFEFMIGNSDWWITSHKNINLITLDSTSKPIAVPYDFDMSGFVEASYSRPPGVPVEFVKDPQVYKGICMTDEEERRMLQYFKDKKEPFRDRIKNDPIYPRSLKSHSLHYLNRFYYIINKPGMVRSEINGNCKQYKEYVEYLNQ